MDAEELVAIASELYVSPIDSFTATRNARANDAKAGGDADSGARIRALRKPSAAAWALNLLVAGSSEALPAIAALRDRIAAATAAGDRDVLRAASRERHDLVDRLLADARSATADSGRPLSTPAAEEVSDALLAALGDADVAAALATGRLIVAPRTGGLAGDDIRALVACPPDDLATAGDAPDDDGDTIVTPASSGRRPQRSSGGGSRIGRGAPRPQVDDAGATRRKRRRDLVAAERAEASARADRARREDERERLVVDRDDLRQELERRRDAVRDAERDLDDADGRLDSLTADIRSRELDWKRAEASLRRARLAVEDDGVEGADTEP